MSTSAFTNEYWHVPEPWCRWYYDRTGLGGRHYVAVVARPDFSLSEMRDWAEGSRLWRGEGEGVRYQHEDGGEHLALVTEGLCIDFRLSSDPAAAARFLQAFRKKNLTGFDATGATAIRWSHVGDFQTAENINYTIEALSYLEDHPKVAVDLR